MWVRVGLCVAFGVALSTGLAAKIVGTTVPAEPITESRIAQLPPQLQPQWRAYLLRSRELMAKDKAALASERSSIMHSAPPVTGHAGGDGMPLDKPAAWYASAEARRVADNIVSFQTPAGGWGKNQDRTGPPRIPGQSWVPVEHLPPAARTDVRSMDTDWSYVGTIDNGATTTEMQFLAKVQDQLAGPEGDSYRASFIKGVRYLLTAQFPNGGWPQIFPLQGGYHDAITFNDSALSDVATLLAAVAAREEPYAFVPADLADQAGTAVQKALELILATQVVVGGKRTIWGQQHDALTLAPVGARNFEPASLSTAESADIATFLMQIPDPSPKVIGAVDDAIHWLKAHPVRDVEFAKATPSEPRQLVRKPGALIWARFYDINTFRPIFGDRDRTIHDRVDEISVERRNGYSWFGTGPASAIRKYEKWRAKLAKGERA